MSKISKYIGTEWAEILQKPIDDHWSLISTNIIKEKRPITPPLPDVLRAFKECPAKELKVVVLGLDPYPGLINNVPVADGLAFSSVTSNGVPPKSLKQIWDAWKEDFNEQSEETDLTYLANQGVLLLNSYLTTVIGKTGAHKHIWKAFTADVIKTLCNYKSGLHFVLLGKEAQTFSSNINGNYHLIYNRSHPASAMYIGGKWEHKNVFSQVNDALKLQGKKEIIWYKHIDEF